MPHTSSPHLAYSVALSSYITKPRPPQRHSCLQPFTPQQARTVNKSLVFFLPFHHSIFFGLSCANIRPTSTKLRGYAENGKLQQSPISPPSPSPSTPVSNSDANIKEEQRSTRLLQGNQHRQSAPAHAPGIHCLPHFPPHLRIHLQKKRYV